MPLTRSYGAALAEVPPIAKPDGSPVTVVDFVSQAVLVSELARFAPGTGFICEESRLGLLESSRPDVVALYLRAVRSELGDMTDERALALLDAPPPHTDDWWVIDPIDGTAGFVAGAHYSVCVARVTSGRAVLGAIGCPRLASEGGADVASDGPGSIVAAKRGQGAWIWCERTRRYRALHRGPWQQPLRWARSMNRRRIALRAQPAFESMGVPLEAIPIDSQCKYALVAAGRADVAVRLPTRRGTEHAWDHLAGVLAASEAGLTATDVLGQPLDASFGDRFERNAGVLCAPVELHAQLVDAFARFSAESPA